MGKEKKLPAKLTQSDIDERDLGRAVTANYVMAGLVTIWTLFSAIIIGSQLLLPYQTAGMILFTLLFGIVQVLCGCALAIGNISSAKAIKARENTHVAHFVAGINTVFFPLGTIVGLYNWGILSRPSVRELCSAPLRGSPALNKPSKDNKKPQLKLVEQPPEVNLDEELPHLDAAEEAMWKKLEEEHLRRNSAGKEQKEDNNSGSTDKQEPEAAATIKLVPGED